MRISGVQLYAYYVGCLVPRSAITLLDLVTNRTTYDVVNDAIFKVFRG